MDPPAGTAQCRFDSCPSYYMPEFRHPPGRAGVSLLYLTETQEKLLREAARSSGVVVTSGYKNLPLEALLQSRLVQLVSVKNNRYRATAAGRAWLQRKDAPRP